MLGSLLVDDQVVVADLEAGIGTLTRLADRVVDVVVAVVEPTAKSIEVAARALQLADERAVDRVVVVANRVRDDDDLARIRDALGHDLVVLPDDPLVRDAERHGLAPLDAAPESPAVQRLVELAGRLEAAAR